MVISAAVFLTKSTAARAQPDLTDLHHYHSSLSELWQQQGHQYHRVCSFKCSGPQALSGRRRDLKTEKFHSVVSLLLYTQTDL